MQIHLGDRARRRANKLSDWAKGNALERQCPKCKRKSALRKVHIVDAGLLLITCRWKDCDYEKSYQA